MSDFCLRRSTLTLAHFGRFQPVVNEHGLHEDKNPKEVVREMPNTSEIGNRKRAPKR
jgi:hypothetical protein